MSSELEDLLVDGDETDKKLVAELLSPFIKIDKKTCEIRPLGNWNELKAGTKILLYLLARKAMIAMKMDIDEEAASAKEITDKTGVVGGTARKN